MSKNTVQTDLPTDGKFDIYFRLIKVDEATHQVWGRATEEIPDAAKEIMDYASSKPLFQKWSDSALKRSSVPGMEQSLGNIREMHGDTAAGKMIALDFQDEQKAIDIGTECVDPTTWEKIRKGVLTGFSIGGHYARKWMDYSNPRFTRFTADPVEISYVDMPAVPTALYTFVKKDGSMEMRKVGAPLPDLDETAVVEQEIADVRSSEIKSVGEREPRFALAVVPSGEEVKAIPSVAGQPSLGLIDKDRAVQAISAPLAAPIEKVDVPLLQSFVNAVEKLGALREEDAKRNAALEKQLSGLGVRLGIARREGSALSAPAGQPSDPYLYGDPANWRFPAGDAAVEEFNKGGDILAPYKPEEVHILGRRLSRLASRGDEAYRYDVKSRKIQKSRGANMATSEMIKTSLDQLMGQVQSEVDVAADQLGVDPAAFRALLANALASAESGTKTDPADTSSSEPSAPTGSQSGAAVTALKVAPGPASSGASTTPTTPASSPTNAPSKEAAAAPSSSGTETNDPPATEGGTSSPGGTTGATATSVQTPSSTSGVSTNMPSLETATTPSMATMKAQIDQMQETVHELVKLLTGKVDQPQEPATTPVVTKVAEPAQPVAPDLMGMLNTLAGGMPSPDGESAAILKALTSGDVDAVRKAAALAGSAEAPNIKRVEELAKSAASESLRPVFERMMMARGYYGPEFTPEPQ